MTDQIDLWAEDASSSDKLIERFTRVRSQSRLRCELMRFYNSLYCDRSFQGFDDGTSLAEAFITGVREKLNERVITRIVCGLSAKFARQRPKPAVLTSGANWAMQQRAKKYDKFIWGVMRDVRAYELQRMSDLHMILTGTGAIHVTSRGRKIYAEAVPPWELFVDTADARYGTPRTLYRLHHIDRKVLAGLYPKHKKTCLTANAVHMGEASDISGSGDSDIVAIVTGWKLPTLPGADDGRIVVALPGGGDSDTTVLDTGVWKRDRFPFAFNRYSLVPEGFWGLGPVEQLVGLQLELNRTLTQRQESLRLMSAPFVLLERGSKIIKTHFSNAIGRIIEYTGIRPEVVAPGVISPEQFNHGDRVKSSMFSQAGVSEMAMQAMKPAGLNSGKALRAYADMQDDGIHDVFVRREQQMLEFAECILDEAEELSEDDESELETVYVGPGFTETVSFSQSKMDRKSFVLSVQPVSALSTTLAGRLEDLEDLRDLGIVTDPSEMQELVQLPDLDTAARRRNAMRELLHRLIEVTMLEEGKSVTPEPGWDLDLAMSISIECRLQAQLGNVDEERIELLRRFEETCLAMTKPPPQLPPPSSGGDVAATPIDPNQPPPVDPLVAAGAQPGASPIAGGESL
jgi:hypothetical protein